jgi:CheY-like chemotaxis protein
MSSVVADDNRDSADSCRLLLEASGHAVRVAYTGQEALDSASQFRPEVALLDIGMPTMNGYQVARRIRDLEWGAQPIDMDALTVLLEKHAKRLG